MTASRLILDYETVETFGFSCLEAKKWLEAWAEGKSIDVSKASADCCYFTWSRLLKNSRVVSSITLFFVGNGGFEYICF